MQVLKFTLSGKNAFFKMPEVNSYCYFTYGNIHKVVLCGIFGAMLGYRGYAGMKKDEEFPEFYTRLKDLKISIVPDSKSRGYIPRKVQSFNHSTGAASEEVGGNLIVKQQWLENPKWDIYVQIDNEESKKISDFILNKKTVYIPYLGSNSHLADISNAYITDINLLEDVDDINIDSLFFEEDIDMDYDDEIIFYKYSEYLPIGLEKATNQYILKKMIFTNAKVEESRVEIFEAEGLNIVFI